MSNKCSVELILKAANDQGQFTSNLIYNLPNASQFGSHNLDSCLPIDFPDYPIALYLQWDFFQHYHSPKQMVRTLNHT